MIFDGRIKAVFIGVCVVLATCGAGFFGATQLLNVYLKKEPVYLRRPFSEMPRTLSGPKNYVWKQEGQDRVHNAEMVENLGTDKYLDRNYVGGEPGKGLAPVSLSIAYYTGMIDTIPHIPDRCYVAAGLNKVTEPKRLVLDVESGTWEQDAEHVNKATGQRYPMMQVLDRYTNQFERVRMPLGDFGLRMTEFQDSKQPNLRIFAGYFFVANGRTTAVPEDIRLLAFDLSEKCAYYAKIQYSMAIPRGVGEEEELFRKMVSNLTESLLPELMRCLPDWSEVEQRDKDKTTAAGI